MSGRLTAAGLALGTVQWGMPYGIANRHGRPADAEVARMLGIAAGACVRTLDTARAYGESEAVIGRLVGSDPVWTVVTKLDSAAEDAQAARDSLSASRAALRRPVLDAVLLHRAHQRTACAGTIWDALRRERDEGRVRRIGVSVGTPEEAWEALGDPTVDCLQVASSLFDQRLSRDGFFERANQAGRTVFVRSVFLQGVAYLDPGELPPHLAPLREPLTNVCHWARQRGLCPADAFLAFAAGLPGAVILIGCETAAQLDENLHNWSHARQRATEVDELSRAVPSLPPEVLNPACWPKTAG
jgi:aryl-alcohol dehydrogenase-like predicted oxidoreductase